MNRLIKVTFALLAMLAVSAASFAAIEIRLKDGTRWRGEVGDSVKLTFQDSNLTLSFEGRITKADDLYLVVHGLVAGRLQDKVIFRSDIRSIESLAAGEGASDAAAGVGDAESADLLQGDPTLPPGVKKDPATGRLIAPKPGVFVLPMVGSVGEFIRHDEIAAIGKEADKYGPGQIIVIIVDTYGGLVYEAEKIEETMRDVQKRHRVVIWIKKAISAGAMLSMCSPEIYFMTEGTCGSVTTMMGGRGAPDEIQEIHTAALVKTAIRSGYSEHIARAMKMSKYMCSYDKDPVTGQVTWYGSMAGKHILSDDKSNLTFTSSNAAHSGFSKGTADRTEDLAKLLDLPEWYEISDYGRRMAKQWEETAKRASTEIPLIGARLGYKNVGTGDPIIIIGTRIQLLEQAIMWWRRAPNVARMSLPPVEDLKDEVERLRKQLADIKRARQRR